MHRVLIAAGGSGGHLIPAQVIAEGLASSGASVSFAAGGLSANPFFDRTRWPYDDIPSAPPSLRRLHRAAPALFLGTMRAFNLLRTEKPLLVVGFGSYHAAPVLAAAALCRVPTVLFTADAVPGRTIRCFSPFARWTGCFFSEALFRLRGQACVVDLPLRPSFAQAITKEEGRRFFGLPNTGPVILVLGGSQGAKALNEVAPKAIALLASPPCVLHLCGHGGDVEAIGRTYTKAGIAACVRPFETQMQYAFAAADAVIARSGASTIAEIEAFGRPALYIPFPLAMDEHQRRNAELAAERGTAIVLDEKRLSPELAAESLRRLLTAPTMQQGPAPVQQGFFINKIIQTLEEVSHVKKSTGSLL